MTCNAYILSIPELLTLEDLLKYEPGLYDYVEYADVSSILQEIKENIEIEIVGDMTRISVLYFIIDYASGSNNLLGELKIPGKVEKIINVEAKGTRKKTRQHILQYGLIGDLVRRLNE